MKYSNTLEYSDAIAKLVKRNLDILALAKSETRELSEEENTEFEKNEEEVKELENEKDELERELEKPQEDNPETKNCDEEENRAQNISNIRKMEKKKFSLLNEIRSAMQTGKTIELRDNAYTVANEGDDVVETEIFDILTPLRAKLQLVNAGAHFLTNLEGDVQIPVMSATNVAWASETGSATDGSGAFSHVTLSPKRLTAYIPLSLQFINQTQSLDAEAAIRNDLVAAIAEKLEATILGDDHDASGLAPDGIFYNATVNEVADYAALCDLEAELEENNVYGNKSYVLSPAAKAAFRAMPMAQNNTGMVYAAGEIDGTPAHVSSLVDAGNFAYGDWNQLFIGSWGNLSIDVVKDSTYLKQGSICIVVNAFFDAVIARPSAFVFGTVNAAEEDGEN